MRKSAKICLYFVADGAVTAAHLADVDAIETSHKVTVKFRNGSTPGNGAPEKADYIAGEPIPLAYLQSYPRLTVEGVDNAELAATDTTNELGGMATDAGETPALSDLKTEIGSSQSAGNGGWGT